jgi:hypothetical protein
MCVLDAGEPCCSANDVHFTGPKRASGANEALGVSEPVPNRNLDGPANRTKEMCGGSRMLAR